MASSTSYTAPDWKDAFAQMEFNDFDSWWNAEGSLVEEGNFRGKDNNISWSNVNRIQLPDGRVVYLKRQQNHFPNNLILKFLRKTTFEIEWKNFQKFQKCKIPTMKIVYFAHRKINGNRQSIIVSEELKGMIAMNELIHHFNKTSWPPRHERFAILSSIAGIVKKLHAAGIIHNALYGRHIYVNVDTSCSPSNIPQSVKSCFIDLERAKYPGYNSPLMLSRDLKTIHIKSPSWPSRDKIFFIKKYLGIKKLTPEAKTLIRKIIALCQ